MAKIVEFITINVAVKDLDAAVARYKAMGLPAHAPMHMPEPPASITDVTFPMGKEGSVSIIAATDEKSPVARFIEKRGEGAYSICLRTDNLRELMKEWAALGMQWVLPEPYEFPAGNQAGRYMPEKLLANWVKPGSNFGAMLEIFEFVGKVAPAPME